MKKGLSKEKLQEYDENGFVLVERLLSDETIAALQQEIDDLTAQALTARATMIQLFQFHLSNLKRTTLTFYGGFRNLTKYRKYSQIFAQTL